VNNISPFAERLKSLIQERGLTHREVAEAAGVTKNAVGKWLKGTIPGARELFRLAKFFGKPMESFFDGIPYVKPETQSLLVDPPGGISVESLSPKWRKFYAGMFEMISTPEDRKSVV
jgi:transcriptional regulator with XRE-family HTH domain